jgi:ABC-type glycerol-3-phosphate transport system substrate-binding protein
MKEKMSRRKFLQMAAGTTAATILASCTPGTPQPQNPTETPVPVAQTPLTSEAIHLEFWNGIGPPEGVLMEEFMKRWQQTRPDVVLNQWTTDWDSFYAKLKISVAQGTLPDLAVIHPWRIAAYGDVAFKPIDSMLASQNSITGDMFSETPWKAIQYKGKQYGLPMDNFLLALYINSDLLKKANIQPPQTEQDMVEIAKSLTSAPQTWGLTTLASGGNTWDYIAWLAHEGQKGYVSEDGKKATFNNDAGIKALQRMYDNIYKDKVTPSPADGLDFYQLFLNKQVALHLGGTWEKFGFDSVKDLNYTSVVFTPKEPGTFGGSHNFVFTSANGDQRNKAAWDAATWIIQNCDAEWGTRAGHIPALKKAAQDQGYLESTSRMPGHRDSVSYLVGLPQVEKIDDVEGALLNSLNEVFLNTKTPAQALSEAEATVNAILQG